MWKALKLKISSRSLLQYLFILGMWLKTTAQLLYYRLNSKEQWNT